MNPTLKVSIRTETGKKLKGIRQKGFIPGIVYGHNISSTMLAVEEESFNKIFKNAGENTLIDLKIEGGDTRTVLIHDLAVDPVDNKSIHIDFYQVRLDEKVKTDVPLNFVGESAAVKEQSGTLLKILQSIEVESLPMDIPHDITIDISNLKTFEDKIRVKDIKLSDKIKVLTNLEETLAMVSPPRTKEEIEKLDEEVEGDVTKVEGVDKGDDDKEELVTENKDKPVENKKEDKTVPKN